MNEEDLPMFRIYGTNTTFISPPQPTWEFVLSGDWSGLRFMAVKGPNVFHRAMQHLMLGICWRRK